MGLYHKRGASYRGHHGISTLSVSREGESPSSTMPPEDTVGSLKIQLREANDLIDDLKAQVSCFKSMVGEKVVCEEDEMRRPTDTTPDG